MACPTVCKLCKRLIISTAVTYTAPNLIITIPAGSYEDGYGIGTGYNGTKSGTVILGWTNEDDFIYFSSINNVD